MNIYTLYIHDDRYSVPTLDIVSADTDDEARAEAAARLGGSPHHQAVEIWKEDTLVARIDVGEDA